MDSMGEEKERQVEKERKSYESDSVWNARKTFLLTHWDAYPRDQLECYSQLFINVNMIGCVYSPTIMAKLKEMGAGIMEKANKLNNERQLVYASRGRAEAQKVMKREEEAKEREKKAKVHDNGLLEKVRNIRNHMQAAQTAAPESLIKMCERVQMRHILESCCDGITVLRINHLVVFKYRFQRIADEKLLRSEVITSVTDSFLHCEPSVSTKNDMIIFNETSPENLYKISLQRRLNIAARHLDKEDGFNSLCKLFSAVGPKLEECSSQLQGWSQKTELRAGELLVATRVLSKNECVKTKKMIALDEMCKPICEAARKGTLKIEDSENGLIIVI